MSSFNQRLPPVSYTKALDVWVGICRTFVFLSVIELIVVNYIARSEEQKTSDDDPLPATEDHGEEIPLNQITSEETVTPTPTTGDAIANKSSGVSSQVNRFLSKYLYTVPSKAERIDRASRVLFPATFLCFMLIYTIAYVL